MITYILIYLTGVFAGYKTLLLVAKYDNMRE